MKAGRLLPALLAVALIASPVRAGDRSAAASDLVEVLSAAHTAIEAQSAFNLARAASDMEAQKDAAAALLVATGEAAFWSKVLQMQVASQGTDEALSADIEELQHLSMRSFQRVSPPILDGDMAALDAVLDDSADTLNGLSAVLGRMTQRMGVL